MVPILKRIRIYDVKLSIRLTQKLGPTATQKKPQIHLRNLEAKGEKSNDVPHSTETNETMVNQMINDFIGKILFNSQFENLTAKLSKPGKENPKTNQFLNST
jgi:hypothetical protein